MANTGGYTYEEITSQPQSWAETGELMATLRGDIVRLWQARPWKQIICTGCGSPYYLSLAAATLFQQLTGQLARGIPASELWLHPRSSYPAQGDVLLIAVSRSGQTTETLNAVRAFRGYGRGQVVTIICEENTPLAGMGDVNIGLPWARERSVAQTRSFASMYLAAVALAAICAGRDDLLQAMKRLPDLGQRLISQYGALAHEIGSSQQWERFYFLGSAWRYGLACELSLKMKEMSLTHSEPFHFLEFRHGPKSMVNQQTLIVGLLAEADAAHEAAVVQEMRALGAKTLILAEQESLAKADYVIPLSSGLPEELRGVLYLPAVQLLAYERSLSKGLNPDSPTHLDAVVRLGDV